MDALRKALYRLEHPPGDRPPLPVRVPIGKDRSGRPIYATRGRVPTSRCPRSRHRRHAHARVAPRAGSDTSPTIRRRRSDTSPTWSDRCPHKRDHSPTLPRTVYYRGGARRHPLALRPHDDHPERPCRACQRLREAEGATPPPRPRLPPPCGQCEARPGDVPWRSTCPTGQSAHAATRPASGTGSHTMRRDPGTARPGDLHITGPRGECVALTTLRRPPGLAMPRRSTFPWRNRRMTDE
jgi:hypothetical protein